LKKFLIIIIIIINFLTLILPAYASDPEQMKIRITKGVTIENTEVKLNAGYFVSFDSNNIKRTLFKVDLADFPQNIELVNAELRLSIANCSGMGSNINIARVTNDWQTDTVTWDDKPGFSTPMVTTKLDCNNQNASLNITDIIHSWLDNTYPNFGLIIYGEDEVGTQQYNYEFDLTGDNSFIFLEYREVSNVEDEQDNRNMLKITFIIVITVIIGLLLYLIRIVLKIVSNKKAEKNIMNKKTIDNNEKSAKKLF